MVNDTIHRLRAALSMSGFTKKALAKECGLHANTLLGCEGDEWNPTLTTLRSLEAALPSWAEIEAKQLPAWFGKDQVDHSTSISDTPDSAQSGKSSDVTAHDLGVVA